MAKSMIEMAASDTNGLASDVSRSLVGSRNASILTQAYSSAVDDPCQHRYAKKAMNKGFGFYSPHESTIFFLKTLLLSFWIGLDVIVGLLLLNIPASVLAEHRFVILGAIAVLSTATVFSLLFAWATGTLFGRRQIETESGISSMLHRIKQQQSWLIGVGFAGSAIPILLTIVYFSHLQRETEQQQQIGRANIGIAKKCAEVAMLEKGLFHSDEQFVMTQCMLQYDRTYAALHERSVH